MRRIIVLLAIAVMVAPLVSPVSPAHAATTWTVRAGSSKDSQALQALLFLPKEITINEGDTVQWALGAADHTIYFPAGKKLPDLIVPGKMKGELLWNPVVFLPSPTKAYDGSAPLSGGVLNGEDPKAPKTPAKRLEINRGDTVTWAMKDPTEVHTVTFGAKEPFEPVTMKPQPQGPPLFLVNPSQPKGDHPGRWEGAPRIGLLQLRLYADGRASIWAGMVIAFVVIMLAPHIQSAPETANHPPSASLSAWQEEPQGIW